MGLGLKEEIDTHASGTEAIKPDEAGGLVSRVSTGISAPALFRNLHPQN